MDVNNLLNLMYWCTNFSVLQHLIKDVRDVHSKKWVHVTSLELNDADKEIAFDAIENLLHDPSLAHDPDAQNALKEIVKLKSVSDLHSMDAKVLADFREQQIELKHGQDILKKAMDDINPIRPIIPLKYDFFNSIILILGTLFWVLSENVKGARKKDVAKWLVLLFLFHCCLVLDDSSIKEGE